MQTHETEVNKTEERYLSLQGLDQLDRIAADLDARGAAVVEFPYPFLTQDEHLYLCLASGRADFLDQAGFTTSAARAALAPEWSAALKRRHH